MGRRVHASADAEEQGGEGERLRVQPRVEVAEALDSAAERERSAGMEGDESRRLDPAVGILRNGLVHRNGVEGADG